MYGLVITINNGAQINHVMQALVVYHLHVLMDLTSPHKDLDQETQVQQGMTKIETTMSKTVKTKTNNPVIVVSQVVSLVKLLVILVVKVKVINLITCQVAMDTMELKFIDLVVVKGGKTNLAATTVVICRVDNQILLGVITTAVVVEVVERRVDSTHTQITVVGNQGNIKGEVGLYQGRMGNILSLQRDLHLMQFVTLREIHNMT